MEDIVITKEIHGTVTKVYTYPAGKNKMSTGIIIQPDNAKYTISVARPDIDCSKFSEGQRVVYVEEDLPGTIIDVYTYPIKMVKTGANRIGTGIKIQPYDTSKETIIRALDDYDHFEYHVGQTIGIGKSKTMVYDELFYNNKVKPQGIILCNQKEEKAISR